MTSRYQVFGLRFALGAALLASACQHDSNAEFDDRSLTSPDGGGAADSGGSNAAAGENRDASGGEASAGSASEAGRSSAGAAGSTSSAAGKGGTASAGGKGGSDAGGTASQAGKAGQGGAAGTTGGGGGMAGSVNPPEPITLETADLDDTHVASCMQQQNFGEAQLVSVDGSLNCVYDALIDFPRLELPEAALVSQATLTLTCSNAGASITVSYANEAWKELTVRWSTRPEVGATIGTITCAQVGTVEIDLTAAFQAWLSGAHAANGIYLRSENTDGTDFGSSEADKVSARPQLSITYTLP